MTVGSLLVDLPKKQRLEEGGNRWDARGSRVYLVDIW